MRTWTLAFVLVTTLTLLALRLDDSAWLQGAARIAVGLGVALAVAYGLRSLGLKLSAYEAALPRHPRTRAPADPRTGGPAVPAFATGRAGRDQATRRSVTLEK